jgi:hypothetical protein
MQSSLIYEFYCLKEAKLALNYFQKGKFYQKSIQLKCLIMQKIIVHITLCGVMSLSRFLINRNLVGTFEMSSFPKFECPSNVDNLICEHLKQTSRWSKLIL